jgi:hypothetical protein
MKHLAALCLLLCGLSAHAAGITIAEGGAPRAAIVVAADAAPPVAHAAAELAHFLQQITGAVIPTVHSAAEAATDYLIDLDNTTGKLPVPQKPYGEEEYQLEVVDNTLVIAGGAPRGVLYGVYDLLEEELGCRWFTPTVSHIPSQADLKIAKLSKHVSPVLEYREPFVMDCYDGDWNARNRMNGNRAQLEEKHGGKVIYSGFVHTFESLVPVSKYYDEHPEYFALVNGKRLKERTQLCCTNPDVVRIVTEGIRRQMRENPAAKVYSVSQNDWFNFCTCESCSKLSEEEGTTGAPVFQLVNQVARAVKEEFPGKLVDTLAYQWTRRAPKHMTFEDNIVVRLCSIECCFAHPFDKCDGVANRNFVRDAEEWAQKEVRLWVWDYTTSFTHYLMPFPNLHVRGPNTQFFVDHKVTGIFEQDVYNTLNGEFSGLSGYVGAKLLWNPKRDVSNVIEEFLSGVYGAAAPHLKEYLVQLHDLVKGHPRRHMDIWVGPEAKWLDDAFLEKADALFDRAETAAAGEPEQLERVRVARLSVDYCILDRIRHAQGQRYEVDHANYLLRLDPGFAGRVNRFFEVAERNQMLQLREQGLDLATYRSNFPLTAERQLTPREPCAPGRLRQGIRYEFFEGQWQELPGFDDLTPLRTGIAKSIHLKNGGATEHYGLRFTGYFHAPRDGVYTFTIHSNDGSHLYLGDELLVDNGGNHKMEMKSGIAALKAGYHPLRVTYFQSGGDQGLEVYVEGPGIARQQMPAKWLLRE